MSIRRANGNGGQTGLSLVELMVALAVGLLLLVTALGLHARASAQYRQVETRMRLNEQLAFALDALIADIRLAGFWSLAQQAALVHVPLDIPVNCRLTGTNVADWALDLATAVEVQDDGYRLPCPGVQPRAGSDVLILRHAGAEPVSPDPGQIQLQAGLLKGQIFHDGMPPAAISGPVRIHDLAVSAWYVSNTSSFGAGQSSLRRLYLVKPGRLEDQEIMAGIENLQVQLGIDTSGDGSVNRYIDGDEFARIPGARVQAVRIWLLIRSDTPEAGYHDPAVWLTPDADLPPIRPGILPGYPANHRRLAAGQTIYLRNGPVSGGD